VAVSRRTGAISGRHCELWRVRLLRHQRLRARAHPRLVRYHREPDDPGERCRRRACERHRVPLSRHALQRSALRRITAPSLAWPSREGVKCVGRPSAPHPTASANPSRWRSARVGTGSRSGGSMSAG